MKKNKLTFLIVTSALAISALIGCGNKKQPSSVLPSSENSVEQPSSNVLPSSEVPQPSSEAPKPSSSEAPKPSSTQPSSEKPSSSIPWPSSSSIEQSSDFPFPPSTTELPPFPPGGSSNPGGSSQAQLVSLVGIELTPPTKSLYTTDDTALDLTGMVLKGRYSDGSKRVISSGYTVSEVDFSTPGQKEVHVTYFGFDSYFLINVEQAVPTDWTSEQKALMGAHLHGLSLPFVSIPSSVTYDAVMEAIVIESENKMAGDFLSNYAALFSASDGWQGGDMTSEEELETGLMYEFIRPVVQGEKTYYVSVYLTGYEPVGTDDGYPSKTGYLYLAARDPYVYEYPATHINSVTQNLYNSSIVIPSIEADHYLLDDYGFIAYSDTNTENSYKALVEATNNFVFNASKDEYGYYRAHAIDAKYDLIFEYDEEEKGLIVYITYCAPVTWPAELISEKMAEHDMTTDTLPALSDNAYMYKISDDDENYDLVISALAGSGRIERFYSSYTTILNNSEFVYDNVTQLYTSPNGEYTVKLEDDGVCTFYIKLKVKYGVWPSSELAAIYETLGFNQDYVPEPTYGNGLLRPRDYTLSQNDDGSYLITATFLKSEDSEDVYRTKEAYISYLRDEFGFTETFYDGKGRFWRLSTHAEFCMQCDCWQNYIYITFKPYVPSNGYDECMESVANTLGTGLTPPSLEISDATNYRTSTYYYQGYSNIGIHVYVSFPSGTNLSDKLAELENSLVEQGYAFNKYHDYGGYLKLLEGYNHVVFVKPYISGDRLCIDVHREDVSLTGYGIYILEYNSDTGKLWSYDYKVAYYDDDLGVYTFDEPIELTAGEYFSAYDFTNEVAFNINIDDTSFDGDVDEYLAYDSEKQEYRVLQDFSANFYLNIEYGNDYLYIEDASVQEGSWDAAQAYLNGWIKLYDSSFEIPDFQISGADAYDAVSGYLLITFLDNSALADKANELRNSLVNQGFHYSNFREVFLKKLDDASNMWLGVDFAICDEGIEVWLDVNEYNMEGEFGLFLGYYDYEDYFVIDAYEFGERIDDDNGYKQYLIEHMYFEEGMVFCAYDFANEIGFNVTIDPYSLNSNYSAYLEHDEETGGYLVKQEFVADVYIKLKYGSDMIYFGLIEEGE